MTNEKEKNPLVKRFGKEKRWINWYFKTIDGKVNKIPCLISRKDASTTDPSMWSTYDKVAEAKEDRVGIIFTAEKTLLGIDIDHCIEDGKIVHEQGDLIRTLIEMANTYCELSPSGTGIHLYLELTTSFTPLKNRHAPFELYTSGRFFTVTSIPFGDLKEVRTASQEDVRVLLGAIGYPWNGTPEDLDSSSKEPQSTATFSDEELLKKMFAASNGAEVKALYDGDIAEYNNDTSRADLAICTHLAFWTNCNAEQMENLWLASGLGNRKKVQTRKDYRARTIAKAISVCKVTYTPSKSKGRGRDEDEKDKKSPTKILLEYIESLEGTILFHDEQGDAFMTLDVKGHQEIWGCRQRVLKKWLANIYYQITGAAPGSEALHSVIHVLEGGAVFSGPLHKLAIRTAWNDGDLWYDLTNNKWQAVKINERGWEIVDKPPILFRRYSHTLPQVIPAAKDGDARLLLKYVNIKDSQHKLLLLVYLISCFIPDFPHVILVIFGSQGSAKSTLSKLLRRVIDPSIIEVASMPDTPKELIQTLAHHAFLFFDNVSYISEIVSDILCKAVTGSGFPKRELYSDDDDIIYAFKRCIGINGINLVGNRPDLLERSLLLQLDRIEDTDRKQEKELDEKFTKDLPLILGGVFNVLVKAIQIVPTIKLTSMPRMADFAVWGSAIAVALGYTQDEFLAAYQKNIDRQTEVVLNENIVATVVMSFMEDKEKWNGTPTDLLQQLNTHAAFQNIDTYEKYWPKASNILMRRLNELAVSLKAVGIIFTSIPGNTREVILLKVVKEGTDGSDGNF